MLPVFSQRTYPGVGDIDDCWVIATIWAAADSRPTIKRPTVRTFRDFAGIPDHQNAADGGNIDACNRGADGCWPKLPNVVVKASSWQSARTYLYSGRPCSVSTDSSHMSAAHRFNFFGKHQVGIVHDGKALRLMNPLNVEGRPLQTISEAELKASMGALIPHSDTPYRLLAFPIPTPGVEWGWDVDDNITAAYSVGQAGTALVRVGITTYGDRINELDLRAGCQAAGIDYGTSIQLTDVTALLKKTGVI